MEPLTVGMLKKYLEGLDDNLKVIVYVPEEECDTFLYNAPVICGIDDFNYYKSYSVAECDDDEDEVYCYFNNNGFYNFDDDENENDD